MFASVALPATWLNFGNQPQQLEEITVRLLPLNRLPAQHVAARGSNSVHSAACECFVDGYILECAKRCMQSVQ
jgi:hypothetical protein